MHWKKEARLLVSSDLAWRGMAAYTAARWSITRWANGQNSQHRKYTVTWQSGAKVIIRGGTSDVLVLREIFLENCYNAAIEATPLTGSLRILDCGANIGLFSVLCARYFVSPALMCVEPDQGNIEILRDNIAHLRAESTAVPAFVGGCNGLGYLDDCGAGEWGLKLSRTPIAGSRPISILDIPSLMKRAGWERIDLLKVDIEGAEAEVFANSESWIDLVDSMIVEIHSGYSLEKFINDISESGRQWKINHQVTCGDQTVCSVRRV